MTEQKRRASLVTESDRIEARRRMQAIAPGERNAWIHAQRKPLGRIINRVARIHGGMIDREKDAWTRLVLQTVDEWQSPACRDGHHGACASGRCTCSCGHEAREAMCADTAVCGQDTAAFCEQCGLPLCEAHFMLHDIHGCDWLTTCETVVAGQEEPRA